jgi:ABC-type glycerol-3-phosphate transport system permease component
MKRHWWIHLILFTLAFLTLVPFAFVINNSFRSNAEMYRAFFGLPNSWKSVAGHTGLLLTGRGDEITLRRDVVDENGRRTGEISDPEPAGYLEAVQYELRSSIRGYKLGWQTLRLYMINSFIVCLVTAAGVILVASLSAYIFSRYRFPGHTFLFYAVISVMMIPGVLTLVPSFLWVKKLGLLNSYWVLILPYIAGGQVFAIFVFRSFFQGLPEELFEAARMDGAGHIRQYLHIVMPLSLPVISVVAIMNILSTWNNFMWPFITNTDDRYHVVASGLYVMSTSQQAANFSTMFSAYVVSSIPLLVLFVYATRPFIQGVTSGAFKA